MSGIMIDLLYNNMPIFPSGLLSRPQSVRFLRELFCSLGVNLNLLRAVSICSGMYSLSVSEAR